MRQVLCSRLVGRDEELTVLRDALAATCAGRGGAVVMLGEAGIGKSRLAGEVETVARREGFQTLRGRAVEGSTGAYRPVAEAILSTLRERGSRHPTGIAGLDAMADLKPFRPILGRLIPEWRQEDVLPDSRFQAVTDDSTVLLGEAIVRLLRALGAGRGCLLVLEDLHWADADTLAVMEYLADNLGTEPVLLLGTIRSDERSAALAQAHRLAARRVGHVLELPRLDQENVEEMARVCLDVAACPEPVVELLTSYTEGLPFLVEELLAAWIGSGALVEGPTGWEVAAELSPVAPLTFADTVNRRLGTLGDETRRLLEVAAILGRHFDWTLLPEATGLDQQGVLERLRRAIDAQLVTADYPYASRDSGRPVRPRGTPATEGRDYGQGAFGFRHALTRQAVLAELLPPERASLSARMLSLVENTHPGLPGEWCDLAARLAEAAGKMDRAGQLLLQSARWALGRGALATVESTLDRARSLNSDDKELSIEIEDALTDVLSLAGKWERAFEVGERLLAALKTASAPPDRRAEIHLRIARAALAAGRWGEASSHLDQARLLAGSLPGADLVARLDALAAHLSIERGRLDEATAFAQSALEGAERAALPDVACEALEVVGRCARVRDLDQAEAAFERARAIAEENGLTVWRIRALHELGTLDIFRGARLDRLLEARDLAVSAGALATAAMVDVQIAAYHDQRSQLGAALEAARRSAAMARRFHLDVTAAAALLFQATAYARLGNRADMESAISEALHLAGSEPDIVAGIWEARAFASLVEEKRKQALDELEMSISAIQGMPATTPAPYHGFWALIRTIEDVDGSAACEAVRLSGATINPVNRAYIGYAEAITLGRSGRGQEAVAAMARADADLAGIDWFCHYGRRLLAEAAITDRWGDPATWLWDACDFFESQGQERLASACKSLLRRAGMPGPHTSRSHAGVPAPFRSLGITRREMEVLSVLAEGLSNKEIGERLFLSPRTVEKHVASLLAKTETRTRSQLVALAVSAAAPS